MKEERLFCPKCKETSAYFKWRKYCQECGSELELVIKINEVEL